VLSDLWKKFAIFLSFKNLTCKFLKKRLKEVLLLNLVQTKAKIRFKQVAKLRLKSNPKSLETRFTKHFEKGSNNFNFKKQFELMKKSYL